jgi:mono/diheme cytochrome c family protein
MKTFYAIALAATLSISAASAAEPTASFKEDVQPILMGRCVSCHSPNGEGYQASGLDLTSYKGIMAGTKFGPMIVPGDPDSSNLMRLLDWRTSPQLRMPHNKKQLSVCDRNDLRAWIRQGAKDN